MKKHYAHPIRLTTNQGNNAFNFTERKTLSNNVELTIPSLKTITSIDQIALGDHVVFEEIDHTGTLRSCTGLKHIYQILPHDKKPGVIIMDNHNHALYFWGRFALERTGSPLPVIHIDQHADLAPPDKPFDTTLNSELNYLREYTNYHCNVGSFIQPAHSAGYISECVQVRTGEKLIETAHTLAGLSAKKHQYILDIDCDFWLGSTSGTYFTETIGATRQLLADASFVTIATSPYFMEQEMALKVVQEIFR